MWLQGWVGLSQKAVFSWLDDHAPTMGAAIAYYTVFSLAPMLVMVIAVAGLAFGREAAEGALFGELADLVGPESAGAVQAMLRSASGTRSGILATAFGIGTLIIGATAVFGELQSALNVIWKVPASGSLGAWHLLKSRCLALSVVLVIGFLLLVSLLISATLAAFSDYLDGILPGLARDSRHRPPDPLVWFHDRALRHDVQNTPGALRGMGRGLAWRGGRGPTVHGRQASHWLVHRQQQHGVDLRCRGRAHHRFRLGLLLGPDRLARRRVRQSA
jgi:hypothetical protein